MGRENRAALAELAYRSALAELAYHRLLQGIELLMDIDPEEGTPECDLFVRLVDTVEDYERVKYPLPLPEATGAVG